MKKISILLTDDHFLLREAWTLFLNYDARFNVIASCGTAEMAIDLVQQYHPDVVVMDINLPGLNGIEATEKIKSLAPDSRILGVSTHKQPEYARLMIEKGATGYVSKYATREELTKAILSVSKGTKYICSTIKEVLAEQMLAPDYNRSKDKGLHILTQREKEIISLVKKGLTSKEIASSMSLSAKTIDVHRHNMMRKLELKNVAELINFVHQHAIC